MTSDMIFLGATYYRNHEDKYKDSYFNCQVSAVPIGTQEIGIAENQASGCKDVCGRTTEDAGAARVIGGQDASPGEWPWAVFLIANVNETYSTQWCGGAILTKTHIL